jgi:hypothetical protein
MSVVLRDGFALVCVSAGFGLAQMLVYYLPAAEPLRARTFGLKDELDGAWAVRPFDLVARPLGRCWRPRGSPIFI